MTSSEIRACNPNAERWPRKRADLRNANGATPTPISTVSRVTCPDSPMNRKKAKVLETEHGLRHLVGLGIACHQSSQHEGAQIPLEPGQLQELRAAQGQQDAVENQQFAVAVVSQQERQHGPQREDPQDQKRPVCRPLARCDREKGDGSQRGCRPRRAAPLSAPCLPAPSRRRRGSQSSRQRQSAVTGVDRDR